ncbi:hypothetical protein SAMN05192548_105833 [Paraburkholderia terricola]|jgi:hypothetical protein|uniref:Uncharacterized protein n=1 Tax=Paraburkholderia terricola TaxID=169427 RepID=A0A1M6XR07_9BURK|nr:hypothetical protein SAMN05192547_105833 [Paraburkholderia sediminicola]SHL08279.1 hypothetical protein SAMN05192548_105833 [Paraburkholderia terricola]
MGDRSPHCIPFGWHRRLYLPEILVQFSETLCKSTSKIRSDGDRQSLVQRFLLRHPQALIIQMATTAVCSC